MLKRILLIIALLLPLMTVATRAAGKFTLVIDAGHGGRDAGAVGKWSKEKDINLKVALAFGSYVERNCPDVNVIYTRKTDVFIPLDRRAEIANKAKADLFISIHTNALPKGKIARGFETYTLGMHRAADNLEVAKRENSVILVESDYEQRYQGFDPNSSESYIIFELMQDKYMERSVELARMVQQEVCRTASRPDKGVHQAGFLVLRATSMPSCLIELGFITTRDEENLLNSSKGIDSHARGIYNAFVKYRKKYDNDNTAKFEPSTSDNGSTATATTSTAVVSDAVSGSSTAATEVKKTSNSKSKPVFKVQIMASRTKLKTTDSRFKGQKDIDSYYEGGMYKYTVGSSTNYNKMVKQRKSLLKKFPEAFIIAFRDGEKMDINEAIAIYNRNK